MNRLAKLVVVLGGYAVALLASVATVKLYDRRFTPADNQTMGGMIAGGEMMLGTGVFLLVALAPTGLALWFLRRHRPTWSAFTIAGLAFAGVGLATVLAMGLQRGAPHAPWLVFVDLFSLAHMLGWPLFLLSFGVLALLAPGGDLRRRLLVAAGIELVIAACSLVHFLAPRSPI
jgi:hypothetical protein